MRWQIPADLYGRPGADRGMARLSRVGDLYEALFRATLLTGARRQRRARAQHHFRVSVTAVHQETDDVLSIRLAGDSLPAWSPGAHVDVTLPSGLVRQYSLCGGSAGDGYQIAVRRVGRGSAELHDVARPGLELTVSRPRNAFPFLPAPEYLFVAGGIGITPILPMVRAAHLAGAEWRLVYFGRSLPFVDSLCELGRQRVEVLPHRPDLSTLDGPLVYCCGPAPLTAALSRSVTGLFLSERFTPPPIVGGQPFDLVLQRTGTTVTVPADRSALSVVRELVPSVPYSCQQGFCGTCRVGDMLLCVDRPSRTAVLDL